MPKVLREWKKVGEGDISYVIMELKECVETPACIILSGDLGLGKTTFAKAMGGEELNSPTYSVIQESDKIVHADLYRIDDPEELVHLEIPVYLEGKEFFLVEWGSKYLSALKNIVPEEYHFYDLEIILNGPYRDYKLSHLPD